MKKIVSLLCSLVLCGGVLFGFCGCAKEDPEKTLYVELSNKGFGIQWIDPLIEIFEAEHPGITVKKTYMTNKDQAMIDKVTSGSTHLDISFPENDAVFMSVNQSVIAGGVKYDSPYADLTDIYNAKVPGEDIALKDKMDPSYREKSKFIVNGKETYYTVPWIQSPLGIVMNNKIYKDSFGKLPNTTDEFLKFCEDLPAGVTACIHANETSYWDDMYDIWVAQYNGNEKQKKFYEGYAICGEQEGERYVPSMFDDDGLRVTLDFLEKLLDPAKGYMHSDSALDFTSVQNVFLEGKKNILFMPNGAWLEREMSANYSPDEIDVQYIKIPIISALGTKLGITDTELSAVIDYIDGTAVTEPQFTSSKGISNADVIAAVREARNMTPSISQHHAIIPSYSKKIGLAKEFLQLMATDRGMEAMLRKSGSCAPYKYDITKSPVKDEISPFMYEINILAEKGYCFYKKDKLFIMNSLQLVNGITGRISAHFASPDAAYHMTAEQVMTTSVNYVSQMWPTYMNKIGG